MPRVLGGVLGGWVFLLGEVPLYNKPSTLNLEAEVLLREGAARVHAGTLSRNAVAAPVHACAGMTRQNAFQATGVPRS